MHEAVSISFPVDDYIPKTLEEVLSLVKLNASGVTAISTCGFQIKESLLDDLFLSIKNNKYITTMSFYGLQKEGTSYINKNIASLIADIITDGREIKELDLGHCFTNEESSKIIIDALKNNSKISKLYLDDNYLNHSSWIDLIDIAKNNQKTKIFLDKNTTPEDIYNLIKSELNLSNISFICNNKHSGSQACKHMYENDIVATDEDVELLGSNNLDFSITEEI